MFLSQTGLKYQTSLRPHPNRFDLASVWCVLVNCFLKTCFSRNVFIETTVVSTNKSHLRNMLRLTYNTLRTLFKERINSDHSKLVNRPEYPPGGGPKNSTRIAHYGKVVMTIALGRVAYSLLSAYTVHTCIYCRQQRR